MSCPHAPTTTVAWCYGEGPDDHALHVADCAECQQVVADHELVSGAAAGLVPALIDADGDAAEPEPEPERADRATWVPWAAAGALAAAVLVAVGLGGLPGAESTPSPATQVAVAPAVDTQLREPGVPGDPPSFDDVDARLDALELELDALNADPSIL